MCQPFEHSAVEQGKSADEDVSNINLNHHASLAQMSHNGQGSPVLALSSMRARDFFSV